MVAKANFRATQEIGRAAVFALARAGADVSLDFQHRYAEAQAVCMQIEGIDRRALPVRADKVACLVDTVEKGLGGIDILVNNAGIGREVA
jgi:3-oxoacyl-[acyl-carrier protein] reductase